MHGHLSIGVARYRAAPQLLQSSRPCRYLDLFTCDLVPGETTADSMCCARRVQRLSICHVSAGLFQYLKDPTISPILTSTLIAFGTVSFNLVAGLVTEKKRADLQLEVHFGLCNLSGVGLSDISDSQRCCNRWSSSETLPKLSKSYSP